MISSIAGAWFWFHNAYRNVTVCPDVPLAALLEFGVADVELWALPVACAELVGLPVACGAFDGDVLELAAWLPLPPVPQAARSSTTIMDCINQRNDVDDLRAIAYLPHRPVITLISASMDVRHYGTMLNLRSPTFG
jgi:hypothetical protein